MKSFCTFQLFSRLFTAVIDTFFSFAISILVLYIFIDIFSEKRKNFVIVNITKFHPKSSDFFIYSEKVKLDSRNRIQRTFTNL